MKRVLSSAVDQWREAIEILESRLLLSAVTDEFNSTSLNTSVWDFRDPVGDSAIVLNGSSALITAPGGTSHDVWTTGNDAPKIMQSVDDGDLEIEVKFASVPSGQYAINGIIVGSDDNNFVRFDFYSSSSTSVKMFAASFSNLSPSVKLNKSISGSVPMYMRISRDGDTWTQSYSYDGSTWQTGTSFTYALDVSEAGVFVGNAGSNAPTYTGAIDYFRIDSEGSSNPGGGETDTTAPTIYNVSAQPATTYADVNFTTNEPTTVQVQYGTGTSYELGSVSGGSSARTTHSIRLTNLAAATGYHYRIVATDAAGNVTTSPDRTFTTSDDASNPPPASDADSDEFNSGLDTSLWQVEDPVGGASVRTSGGALEIAVPAGSSHDVWKSGNDSVRVMQQMDDGDFTIEVKFNSAPSGQYAIQGLLIEANDSNFLRFDFYSTSSTSVKVFAASFVNNSPSVKLNRTVSNSAPMYMRITREGDRWTQSYSFDGSNWTTGASFTFAMNVTAAGVFAGNAGSNPAFTARADYFRVSADTTNTGGGDDTTAPQIQSISAAAGDTYVDIAFTTNESTIASVRYGLSSSYELGTASSSQTGSSHVIRLANLPAGATIHYQILVTDPAGNAAVSNDRTVTLTQASQGDTDIDVWYGSNQGFGYGTPQKWVNILGNVSDSDGISSLSFTLNGGSARSLSIGPDSRRLENPGDFNVEINRDELREGTNTIVITAVDGRGNVTSTTVSVDFTRQINLSLSSPITFDWSRGIENLGQVVDGWWTIENGQVRPVEVGYDRLLAVGETTWTDYEVTIPITIHGYDSAGFASPSNGPAVGILLRWQGHYDWNGSQPNYGYAPYGAIGWYRWDSPSASPTLQIYGSWSKLSTNYNKQLDMNRTYIWKMRAQTLSNGTYQYSLKVWPQDSAEPRDWDTTAITGTGLSSGSVVVLAHHVDASFGDVTVRPI